MGNEGEPAAGEDGRSGDSFGVVVLW